MKYVFLAMTFVLSIDSFAAQEISYPKIDNGGKVLLYPEGRFSTASYCSLVLNCTYSIGGCYLENTYDYFSSESNADGVCKALGYTQSLAFVIGQEKNQIGEFRTYNSDGYLVGISQQKKVAIKKTENCSRVDVSGRTYFYEGKTQPIYISITCK